MAKQKKGYTTKPHDFEISGVTSPAKDGSDRQAALKEFFEEDLLASSFSRSHNVRLEEIEENGEKVLAVFADGKDIGIIPADRVQAVKDLTEKAVRTTVVFGVGGRSIEEYEQIVDRYKDRVYWKKEDPSFNMENAKKEYDQLMKDVEEGSYNASLRLFTEVKAERVIYDDIPEDQLTSQQKKEKEQAERMLKQFKVLFGFSIVILVMGILFLKISLIMAVLNIVFGLLGIYFSRRYTRQIKMVAEQNQKKRQAGSGD